MFSGDYYTTCRDARHALCTALDYEPDSPTLQSQIATQRDLLSVATIEAADIERIYRFQYRKHFGKEPRTKFSRPQVQTIFSRVFALYAVDGIDPATYIAANMHGMRFWLQKNPRMSFQPNMLSGPRAMNRYRVYCEIANRRLRGSEDGLDARTVLGSARAAITDAEELVGRAFVAAYVHGHPVSLREAADTVHATNTLPEEWRDIRALIHGRPRPASLLSCYGAERLKGEYHLSQLTAAAAVGDNYVPGFRDKVGVRVFSWDTLSELIGEVRLKPRRRRFTGKLPYVRDGSLAWGALA